MGERERAWRNERTEATSGCSASSKAHSQLYALFKCATIGLQPTGTRPAFYEMTARAKHDAWQRIGEELGGSSVNSRDEARSRYIALARSLGYQSLDAGQRRNGAQGMVAVSTMASDEPEESRSELHALAIAGDVQGIRRLAPRDVDVRDAHGFTALHLAADRGRVEAVKALLDLGADSSLKVDGSTALDLADFSEQAAVVAVLTK